MEQRSPHEQLLSSRGFGPRIIVVGHCASGKTTITQRLQALGLNARATGQEHSAIPDLWRRSNPDVLIALWVDLGTIRERRGASWSEAIYLAQRERLAPAYAAANLIFNATRMNPDEIEARIVAWLQQHPSPQVDPLAHTKTARRPFRSPNLDPRNRT